MRRPAAGIGALILSLAGGASAAGAPVVAIQDDQITNDASAVTIAGRADRLAATGARVTRVSVDWSLIAPVRPVEPANPDDPAYRWEALDRTVAAYGARGVAVMLVLYGTPPWATPGGTWNAAPPPVHFGVFAGTLARRYNGTWPSPDGGTLPRAVSISPGNEPNLPFWMVPQCRRVGGRWVPESPRRYAAMLRQAYPRIKAASPAMLVVAGETLAGEGKGCRDASSTVGTKSFITLMHRALGGTRKVPFDVWGQHLHPVGPPDRTRLFPSWHTLPEITRLVNAMHPRGRMPIAVTETSYTTSYSAYHRYFVTEAQQAAWLDVTYRLAARQPQVELVVWFNLQDHWDWPAGLYRDDWSAKPSLAAFRRRVALNGPPAAKWSLP